VITILIQARSASGLKAQSFTTSPFSCQQKLWLLSSDR